MTAIGYDRAAITLLVVVPNIAVDAMRWTSVPGAPAPDTGALQSEADAKAQKLLRRTIDRLPAELPVKYRIRRGKPGSEICAQAAECGEYRAILLGARGRGRLGTLTGSVSSYVLHHAHTNVIVVHSPRAA
jgi:nucleotide-binding universal stress UspA family protein